MTQKPASQQIDERLTSLLEIEQQLEARFKEAEAVARAKVEAARLTLARAREDGVQVVDGLAAEEERGDVATHEAALRAVEEERNAALTKLAAVNAEAIDRLARRVLERVIAPPRQALKGGPP